MSPAARIMDVFPALRDAPEWLMPVKKHARLLHQVEQKLFLGHWLDAKKKVESGTANVSPISSFPSMPLPQRHDSIAN